MKNYRKKGARKTTASLTNSIKSSLNGEKTVLDIGGGIGAVHLELLKHGLENASNVDASSAYLAIAKEESERQGYSDRISYYKGDFMDHSDGLQKFDIVVLDKVICCYPHMQDLLNSSAEKSNSILALTYPKSNLIGRMIIGMANLYSRFRKSAFRAYLHPNLEVVRIIREQGFELKVRNTIYPWNVEVYQRVS